MSLEKIFDFFASLRLAVVILTLALILVFVGTLAQESLGLYLTQTHFFQSAFVDLASFSAGVKKFLQMFGVYVTPTTAQQVLTSPHIPVFPGGYTLGFLFLLNLLASQIKTFELSVKKFGLILAHLGVILLLLGQLGTDMFAVESSMHLREGDAKNYTELDTVVELAVTEITDADHDRVTAIPQNVLMHEREIRSASLPFTIRINKFYKNSEVSQRDPNSQMQPPATQGFGPQVNVRELPPVTAMDRRDMSSVVVELVTANGSLGTWFLSMWIDQPQHMRFGNRDFHLELRPERHYKDYSLHLLKFTHEVYPGTDIPKDFASQVIVRNHKTGEERQVRIYMNTPLRYMGDTYYQSGYDPDNKGTILQVVRNPGWLTPYVACTIVGVGLVWQFLVHLIPFLKRKVSL